MASTINADNGVVSGSSGVKTTADTSGVLALQSNGSTGVTLDTSLNVGIGRSPVTYGSFKVLDVAGASGAIQKWVHTGSTVELQAYASSSLTAVGSATNHPLLFVTNDTERVRIDTSGNVGIGGTPDAAGYKLQVLGSTGVTGIQFTRTGAASGNWSISAGGAANTLLFYDQASSAEKARINAYGLGIGGATPSSGMGITFPATQSASSDANTLDDYEEGTWTPTQGAGLTVVGTFSSSGRYEKIGRQVRVTGVVSGSTSVAVNSNGEIMAGLPFSTSTTIPYQGGALVNAAFTLTANAAVYGSSVYSQTTVSATANISINITYNV